MHGIIGLFSSRGDMFLLQVRNLELFFAEAVSQECKHVLTGGAPQSGHCRAVSLTARVLGLVPHVVIQGVEYLNITLILIVIFFSPYSVHIHV